MSDRNQDKEKREKQGDPEHDDSVLNPERKDELDLSKKERRLIEKEKLKFVQNLYEKNGEMKTEERGV